MLIRKCLNLIIFSSEEFLGKMHQNNTYSNAVKLPTLVYQVSVIFKTFYSVDGRSDFYKNTSY